MSTREQAEQVLNNRAFKESFEDLKEELLSNVLSSPVGTDELMLARLKYDSLVLVQYELERRLRSQDNE